MATQEPSTINLCRTRGDTFPFTFSITDGSGTAIDITGFSFLLTVDPSDAPSDALNNLFQLTGSITDGPGGKVQFTLSVANADQTPSTYFYDLQQTDTGSNVRTIAKGEWQVTQDITK